MKKKSNLILTIVGLSLLVYVIYSVGAKNILEVFKSANYIYLVYAFFLFSFSQYIRVKKWEMMGKTVGLKLKLFEIARFYFHTRLMGIVTPFRSGEVIPTFFENDDKDKFFSITLADRFYESLATFLIVAIAFFAFFKGDFNENSWVVIVVLAIILFLFYLLFTVENIYIFFRKILSVSKNELPQGSKRNKIIEFLDDIFLLIKKTLGIKTSIVVFAMTLLATAFDVLLFMSFFYVVNVKIDLAGAMLAFSFLTLINFIAPTPSGIGVGDTGYLVLAQKLNVGDPSQVGSFLILARISTVFMTLIFVFVFNKYGKIKS